MNKIISKFLAKREYDPCNKCPCFYCEQNYWDGDYNVTCGFGKDPYCDYYICCFIPNCIKKIIINRRYRKEDEYWEKLLEEERKTENEKTDGST